MTQQLTSMPGHYLKPKRIWAILEMQQGIETGWGKYNLVFVPLHFFSRSHCPCNFFFFLSCFQYKTLWGNVFYKYFECEELWERSLAVTGWSTHRRVQLGRKAQTVKIFENILEPTFCYLAAWFDFVIIQLFILSEKTDMSAMLFKYISFSIMVILGWIW